MSRREFVGGLVAQGRVDAFVVVVVDVGGDGGTSLGRGGCVASCVEPPLGNFNCRRDSAGERAQTRFSCMLHTHRLYSSRLGSGDSASGVVPGRMGLAERPKVAAMESTHGLSDRKPRMCARYARYGEATFFPGRRLDI
jgi:hypothetical protein